MSKKTMMKPIAAMLLAFALLLTGVVPGTMATAKAAEGTYAVFEYQDEDGEVINTSEKIYNGDEFELAQDAVGTFKIYNGDEEINDGGTWTGVMRNNGTYGINGSNHSYVHRERATRSNTSFATLISFFVKITVNTDDIDYILSLTDDLKKENYTEESWNAFETAVNNATALKTKIQNYQTKAYNEVRNDPITQETVDDASIDLSDALLVLKQEDLNNAIKKAEEIKNDNYTEESWEAFTDALSTAKSLMSDEIVFVSPEDLQAATEDLNNAIASLKKKPAEVTTEKKTETTTVKQETTAQYTVAKTTLKKARKSGKKVQLTWKKVKAATGYEVYQATKKNGKYKKVKTIKKNKVVTCKTKALKANKKYFFKVRTYRKVAGTTVYGKFSNVKKVVMK